MKNLLSVLLLLSSLSVFAGQVGEDRVSNGEGVICQEELNKGATSVESSTEVESESSAVSQ